MQKKHQKLSWRACNLESWEFPRFAVPPRSHCRPAQRNCVLSHTKALSGCNVRQLRGNLHVSLSPAAAPLGPHTEATSGVCRDMVIHFFSSGLADHALRLGPYMRRSKRQNFPHEHNWSSGVANTRITNPSLKTKAKRKSNCKANSRAQQKTPTQSCHE